MEYIIINIITVIIGLILGIVFGFLLFKQYIYKGPNSNIISKEIHIDSRLGKHCRNMDETAISG